MKTSGPGLELLLSHLAECPPEFLLDPIADDENSIKPLAVVHDLLAELAGADCYDVEPRFIARFNQSTSRQLRLILITCWLLHHPWFRGKKQFCPAVTALFDSGLDDLAQIIEGDQFVSDPDRREELVRRVLASFDLRPAGETESQANDRLTTLDSVERTRLIREAETQRERARQVMEAMKKKSAEAAAAKTSRE